MGIREHPLQGSLVTVDYSAGGFVEPEMVKRRLAVVLSPKITARPKLCTIVPLSLTAPLKEMPYHKQIRLPFELPREWGDMERWIKGDMVNAVGFHRIDLLRLGKDDRGKRVYQTAALPADLMKLVRQCVLHGLGLSSLTKHL
ncbi:type II toxin-antitoxin system PemK/MazF family toxin [Mesorhizobium sp. RP14(2022)]|uniref:Type II toxin-antitoxin system PemK/MazF family toxin n=1 Tax=Mesorhizobium liriopis TaxID=2953882 RepID=A0ABT1C1V7_9HYPH|nr:type II toxin-antitoxin system PemK/MazF family toxin [Mesorhizobium liriopis]MCO6048799.1 type II toxin-antitoxin system PemK/MazF family toxin [Mesorhizobium liriopis]